jgi:arylsulfatase A-like enzyme/Flp pilus assembly protein TadD
MTARHRKRLVLMKKEPPGQAASPPASRRRFILVAAGIIIVIGAAVGGFCYLRSQGGKQVAGDGLNVLLITADTTRADYLGCYGRPGGRTPNIDRLAGQGVLFEKCIASVPLTLPSHASLMTADYPYVHNARSNGVGRLPEANVTLAEILKQAGYATQATVASIVLNRQFGIAQGFDVYHDVTAVEPGDAERAQRKGDEIAGDAIDMLHSLAGAPFFLWVHLYDPHKPYETNRTPPYTPAEAYEDEIAFMDEQIGRLLDELHSSGLDQSTVVVLVGDHGEGLGEHAESQHGYFLYQSTLHVPLMIRCPGKIAAGTTVADVVRMIDVAPTILALLGLPPLPHAQGQSLLPWVSGQRCGDLYAYSETLETHGAFGLSPLRAATTAEWEYVLAPTPELYHLPDDPDETHSLAADRPEIAARMRQELHDLIAEAPPAVRDESPAAGLSDTDRARLESLGYAGTQVRTDSERPELERFEPQGGNPADYAAQIEATLEVRELLRRGEFEAAQELLRPALQAMPDAPQVFELQAMILLLRRRSAEAIPVLERALAVVPDSVQLRTWYGSALNDVRRYEEAAEQFRIVLRDNLQNPQVLNNMAISLIHLGRLDEADQHLQWALAVEPRNARLLHTQGVLRGVQRRFAEAEQCFVEALKIDPTFRQCQQDLRRLRESVPDLRP